MTAYVKRRKLNADRNFADVASTSTSRTNLGLGTGDSPQFTAIELGHASDTTIARSAAGVVTVEGNRLARIKTGSYTGDGATSMGVTGVGFQPKFVWIWASNADGSNTSAAVTTDTIVDNDPQGLHYNIPGAAAGNRTMEDNGIISLDSDGFTVDDNGADSFPNTSGQAYEYMALG